jgi:hypothetical protein
MQCRSHLWISPGHDKKRPGHRAGAVTIRCLLASEMSRGDGWLSAGDWSLLSRQLADGFLPTDTAKRSPTPMVEKAGLSERRNVQHRRRQGQTSFRDIIPLYRIVPAGQENFSQRPSAESLGARSSIRGKEGAPSKRPMPTQGQGMISL